MVVDFCLRDKEWRHGVLGSSNGESDASSDGPTLDVFILNHPHLPCTDNNSRTTG